jgi:hypothetical protein
MYSQQFGRLDYKAVGYSNFRDFKRFLQRIETLEVVGRNGHEHLAVRQSAVGLDALEPSVADSAASEAPQAAALAAVASPMTPPTLVLPYEPGIHAVAVPRCVFRGGTSTDAVSSLTLKFNVALEHAFIPSLTAMVGGDDGTITLNPTVGVPRRMVEGGDTPAKPPLLRPNLEVHSSMGQGQEYELQPNTAVATVEICGEPLLKNSGT